MMKNEIKITGKQDFMGLDIPVVLGGFGSDKKCISDKTIAEIHDMKVIHVREKITDNLKRFAEGIDIIDLKVIGQTDNNLLLSLGYSNMQISKAEHIYILSERGYSKLIKIMDTDLAWDIHERLVDDYFQLREDTSNILSNISLELQAVIVVDKRITEVNTKVDTVNADLQSFKMDLPILGLEEDRITSAVKRRGVHALGGKNSNAYKDRSPCQKVYRDIYRELYRQFGISTFKAIKRSQCDLAVSIVDEYELPYILQEQINDSNAQMNLEVA